LDLDDAASSSDRELEAASSDNICVVFVCVVEVRLITERDLLVDRKETALSATTLKSVPNLGDYKISRIRVFWYSDLFKRNIS
jgi:hypothetical protein